MLNCLHHEEKCQQYKDQPQHPVFPLQLRHLRQNAQSFLRKSSKANLFEENKIPSDPVPIVKLPAAKHWAHAGLVFKYISNSCTTLRYPDKKKFIKQICCQPLVSSRLRRGGSEWAGQWSWTCCCTHWRLRSWIKQSRVFHLAMIVTWITGWWENWAQTLRKVLPPASESHHCSH